MPTCGTATHFLKVGVGSAVCPRLGSAVKATVDNLSNETSIFVLWNFFERKKKLKRCRERKLKAETSNSPESVRTSTSSLTDYGAANSAKNPSLLFLTLFFMCMFWHLMKSFDINAFLIISPTTALAVQVKRQK